MARCIALSILSLISIGCGHADGLRVEWNEASSASSPEPDLVVEEDDAEPSEDIYALEIESMLPVASVVFMDPADGRFVLRELDCSWQGNRCAGFLPFEARGSHYLTVRAYRGRCPDVRLYRNGFEIDVERMRLEPCAFSMEADPD